MTGFAALTKNSENRHFLHFLLLFPSFSHRPILGSWTLFLAGTLLSHECEALSNYVNIDFGFHYLFAAMQIGVS
jgi:hypothetical protein